MIKLVIGGLLSFLSFQSWGNPVHLNCYADKDNTEGEPKPLIIDLGKKTASFAKNSSSQISHMDEYHIHWSVFHVARGNFFHYTFDRMTGMLIAIGYLTLSDVDVSNYRDKSFTSLHHCERQKQKLL